MKQEQLEQHTQQLYSSMIVMALVPRLGTPLQEYFGREYSQRQTRARCLPQALPAARGGLATTPAG